MKLEVTVCNVCKSVEKPTKAYTIMGDAGRSKDVDLCVDDAKTADLESLLGPKRRASRARKAAPATPPRPRGGDGEVAPARRGRRRQTPILTPAEIEQRKREQAAARA